MTALVMALRGAAAIAVLTTLAGGIPRTVRLGLAIVFGLWAMLTSGSIFLGPDDLTWIVAARELVIGATLGVVAVVPLLAAQLAGRLVDLALPQRTQGPYASLFAVLAAAVFVGIDGHVTFAASVAESYATVPVVGDTQPRVLAALGSLIGAGVRLAIPWLVTAAVVELAVGAGTRIANRAAPHAPVAAAVPAALAMMTAALVATLAVAIVALVRGTL